MKAIKVVCPQCGVTIRIPFLEKLKAKAVEEYDLAERSAQDELFSLQWWLANASLWDILKGWLRRKK